jgi:hypothetical protein
MEFVCLFVYLLFVVCWPLLCSVATGRKGTNGFKYFLAEGGFYKAMPKPFNGNRSSLNVSVFPELSKISRLWGVFVLSLFLTLSCQYLILLCVSEVIITN